MEALRKVIVTREDVARWDYGAGPCPAPTPALMGDECACAECVRKDTEAARKQ